MTSFLISDLVNSKEDPLNERPYPTGNTAVDALLQAAKHAHVSAMKASEVARRTRQELAGLDDAIVTFGTKRDELLAAANKLNWL